MMKRFERWTELASPFSFAAIGGMSPAATTVYRTLALLLVEKWNNYSHCLFYVRRHQCFSLLRSVVMCLRGHRSSKSHPVSANVDLVFSEGYLDADTLE